MRKLLKIVLICILLMIESRDSFGQITFSRRLPVISGTVFYSVNVLNEGYLLDGGTIDSTGGIHPDLCVIRVDANGETQEVNHFGEFGLSSSPQYHSKSLIPGIYLQQSVGLRNDTACVVVSWHNTECDTMRTRFFRSPYIQLNQQFNTFINPMYSLLMPDSTVYLSTVIAQPVTANDVCIWKLDADGNELWHYIYSTEGDPETCYAILPTNDGIVAAIFKGNDQDFSLSSTNLIYLDEFGNFLNEIDEFNWSQYSTAIRDMERTNPDLLVCVGNLRESNNLQTKSYVWLMDSNGSVIWDRVIGGYPELSNDGYYMSNVVTANDGNFIASGYYGEWENDTNQMYVHLAKLNAQNGDLIWTRYYQIIENSDAIQRAFDLKATPDGGVVFCGEATDYDQENVSLENPIQQGWICKLDACGCLVPGCDENCIVGINEHEETTTSGFLVGPNPASDFLNIYLKPQTSLQSNVRFELTTTDGKLVKQFSAGKADTTYLLDVSDLATGNYLLTLMQEGQMKEVKRVVVE